MILPRRKCFLPHFWAHVPLSVRLIHTRSRPRSGAPSFHCPPPHSSHYWVLFFLRFHSALHFLNIPFHTFSCWFNCLQQPVRSKKVETASNFFHQSPARKRVTRDPPVGKHSHLLKLWKTNAIMRLSSRADGTCCSGRASPAPASGSGGPTSQITQA